MKILLAPSESKTNEKGENFYLQNLSFSELFSLRQELWRKYLSVFENKNENDIFLTTGLKNTQNIDNFSAISAISRYNGVAFSYLDYASLNDNAKKYLNDNLIIFSNLFGILRPNDKIPNYKLKQGTQIQDLNIANFYKPLLSKILDEYLQNDEILDLRASFYDKFYIPTKPYLTLKFIKNGKIVSHWAKAYRGLVLRHLASNLCKKFDDLNYIDGLKLKDITQQSNKITYCFEISQN